MCVCVCVCVCVCMYVCMHVCMHEGDEKALIPDPLDDMMKMPGWFGFRVYVYV
jgi:hypothetical protein